ncbi:MAG: hypothetical protein RLZZ281_478 [Pseudomonadota bacterium]|jgi:uncharacterized alpha-E superfamily protein
MLSRTADSLFWMSRYIERAENTARLLDVQRQAVLLPGVFAEENTGYTQTLHDLVANTLNPSSIVSCIGSARENCRTVRGTVNTDVWETVNATWLELQSLLAADHWKKDPFELFEWVKLRSHLFRGITIGTMLKDEAFHFMRLGTFIERADSTARILDAKFSLQERAGFAKGGADERTDYYYWASVLRSVSALEIYRKVYRDVITRRRVAELLIQRADMPRSLLACLNEVCVNLEQISDRSGTESQRVAGRLRADLQYLRIDDAFERGIHDFLEGFSEQIYALGTRLCQEFSGARDEPLLA